MARLTEEMVIARSKQSDLSAVTKLNCWGAELTDVTLLRRMPNVEVLAFSINKIRKLEDFAWCGRLRELYVRKNDISSLAEIRHLRRLPALHSLWLDENPCTEHPQYRMTVLRNLPNLEKLDNVPVQPEEVAEAMRRGEYIPDSDDEGYPQQADSPPRAASPVSPQRPYPVNELSDSPEPEAQPPEPVITRLQQSPPPRPRPASAAPRAPADMTASYTEPRVHEDAPLRHSVSTHSVKEYSMSYLADGRPSTSPLHEGRDRGDPRSPGEYDTQSQSPSQYSASELAHTQAHTHAHTHARTHARHSRESDRELRDERECDRDRESDRDYARDGYTRDFRDRDREREREREYPSAVMGARRGFSRRPVTRNSNLLSALLCLVKELDYPSLEVAEMAVRCRMDELANGQ